VSKEKSKTRYGLHTSVAGGLGEMLKRAQVMGENAAQIFVKSNRQWSMTKLDEKEAEEFRNQKKGKTYGSVPMPDI
jgi:endonuclease IV